MPFKKGDFVWAKVKGYPQWPARIEGIVHLRRNVANPTKYHVFFYGTHETGLVSEQDLKPYEEFKAKFKRPLQRHGFAEGIWEIEEDPQMTISTEGRAKRRGVPRKAPAQPKVAKKTRRSNDENAPCFTPAPPPPTTSPSTSQPTVDTVSRLTRSSSRRASLRSAATGPTKPASCSTALKQECFDTAEVLAALAVPTGGGLADVTNSAWLLAEKGIPTSEGAVHTPRTASPCSGGSSVTEAMATGVTSECDGPRTPGGDGGGGSGFLLDSVGGEAPLSPIIVTPPMRRPAERAAEPPSSPLTAREAAVDTTLEAPLATRASTEHPCRPPGASEPLHKHSAPDSKLLEAPQQTSTEPSPTAAFGETTATADLPDAAEGKTGGVSSCTAEKEEGQGVELMTEEATVNVDIFKEQHLRPVPMETNDFIVTGGGSSLKPSTVANTQCDPLQQAQPHTSSTHSTSQLNVDTDTWQPKAGKTSTQSSGGASLGKTSTQSSGGASLGKTSTQSGGGASLPPNEQVQTVPTEKSKDDDFRSLSEVTSVDGSLVPQSKEGEGTWLEKVQAIPHPAAVGGALGVGPRAVGKASSIAGRGKGKQKCDSSEVRHLNPPKTATTVELLTTLNYNIKCALRRGQPNMHRAMRHLNDLHYLEMDAETLNRVPDLVRTIRKLEHYKGNKKVEKKAAEIFTKFKGLFVANVCGWNKGKAAGSGAQNTSTHVAHSDISKHPSLPDAVGDLHSTCNSTHPSVIHSTLGAVDDTRADTDCCPPPEGKREGTSADSAGRGEEPSIANNSAATDTTLNTTDSPALENNQEGTATSCSAGTTEDLHGDSTPAVDNAVSDTHQSPPLEVSPDNKKESTDSSSVQGGNTVTALQVKQIGDTSVDGHLTMQGLMEVVGGSGSEVDQIVP